MLRTPLHDLHLRLGARMVEFAGWEMPVMYSSIIEEHLATRNGCTMFDVSHMGRLYLSGPESTTLLEQLCTRRIADMEAGQSRYSHMCREDGGILDDVIVSRLADDYFLVVCNASNRKKINDWINHHAAGRQVELTDRTCSTAMVAIQGPQTADIADELLPLDLNDVKRYRFRTGQYMGVEYLCARTGYTGEDGFEIIVSSAAGRMMTANLFGDDGHAHGRITPAGLGARDTLRLEAAMPLYGHELSEEIDSISAGQGWCVDAHKDFIGSTVLQRIREQGPARTLVGMHVEGRRIARQGAPILHEGAAVGTVTSGTLSPTLGRVIALGLVDRALAAEGTTLHIAIRDTVAEACIVPLPFYKRSKKG